MMRVTVVAAIHIALWIAIMFGGVLSSRWAAFSLGVGIPCIYLLHLLPIHILVRYKVRHIYAHLDDYPLTDARAARADPQFRKYLPARATDDDLRRVTSAYRSIEDGFVLPRLVRAINDGLFADAFQKPFTPQGMLIFAAILNYYML
jgi:hypothetical protein